MAEKHIPTEITYHSKAHLMEIAFNTGERFELPAEYLRVYSPSAEVQGHGTGQEILQIGKQDEAISKIEQVGNYAVQLFFDDNHDTGIYSWDTLYRLGQEYGSLWPRYLQRLKDAGHNRPAPKHAQE